MEEFELVVAEENKFEVGAKKSSTSLKIRTVKILMQETQLHNFLNESLSTNRTFSMPTLSEEI